jgi:hypothetical protein
MHFLRFTAKVSISCGMPAGSFGRDTVNQKYEERHHEITPALNNELTWLGIPRVLLFCAVVLAIVVLVLSPPKETRPLIFESLREVNGNFQIATTWQQHSPERQRDVEKKKSHWWKARYRGFPEDPPRELSGSRIE